MSARKIPLTPVTVIVGAVFLAFLGGLLWLRLVRTGLHSKVGAHDVILRLSGSNTIGAGLAPALAEEFLKQQGATKIKTVPGDGDDEVRVQGVLPGDRGPKAIEIHAHGSATAFEDLANGRADIGMSSRKIKAEEAAQLASLGDMTSPVCEHIVGLDGIAVIVSRKNPVRMLAKDQIAQIFTGAITNWLQVGGADGAIKLYARDDKSGTYDTFKNLVLGNAPLAPTAKRIEDSRKLSRRLYFYMPAQPQQELARKFVDFALSSMGQNIVAEIGFVGQNVSAAAAAAPTAVPEDYRRLTSGYDRLSLDFRFREGKLTARQ